MAPPTPAGLPPPHPTAAEEEHDPRLNPDLVSEDSNLSEFARENTPARWWTAAGSPALATPQRPPPVAAPYSPAASWAPSPSASWRHRLLFAVAMRLGDAADAAADAADAAADADAAAAAVAGPGTPPPAPGTPSEAAWAAAVLRRHCGVAVGKACKLCAAPIVLGWRWLRAQGGRAAAAVGGWCGGLRATAAERGTPEFLRLFPGVPLTVTPAEVGGRCVSWSRARAVGGLRRCASLVRRSRVVKRRRVPERVWRGRGGASCATCLRHWCARSRRGSRPRPSRASASGCARSFVGDAPPPPPHEEDASGRADGHSPRPAAVTGERRPLVDCSSWLPKPSQWSLPAKLAALAAIGAFLGFLAVDVPPWAPCCECGLAPPPPPPSPPLPPFPPAPPHSPPAPRPPPAACHGLAQRRDIHGAHYGASTRCSDLPSHAYGCGAWYERDPDGSVRLCFTRRGDGWCAAGAVCWPPPDPSPPPPPPSPPDVPPSPPAPPSPPHPPAPPPPWRCADAVGRADVTQLCTSGSLGCEGLRADAIGMGGFGGFRCDAWLETAAQDPYSLRLCVANPKVPGRCSASEWVACAPPPSAPPPPPPPPPPMPCDAALAGRLDSRTALAAPKRCDELDATKYVCGSWYTSIGAGVEIATGSPEPENRDFLQLCELRPGSNRCFGVWLLCEGGAPSADSDDGWF